MKVPENFTLVEMPENKQVKLPGDLASFNYLGMFQKDTYRLSIDFEIKKARIDAQYYRALREFYDIIVAKINEPVVLRKTN